MPELQKLYDAILNGDQKTSIAVTARGAGRRHRSAWS